MISHLKILRDGDVIFTLRDNGPADTQKYPSISAAKRAVRTGGFKLGEVRKLRSFIEQFGEKKALVLIRDGKEAVQ